MFFLTNFRYRNDIEVSNDPQLKGRYEVIDAEYKFIISNPKEEDAGTFVCKEPIIGEEGIFNVVGEFHCNRIKNQMNKMKIFFFFTNLKSTQFLHCSESVFQTIISQSSRC